jgi:hypothetical protein
MSLHVQCEELLKQAEKLLRQCDNNLATAMHGEKDTAKRRRNAVNAACNALHRATKANGY